MTLLYEIDHLIFCVEADGRAVQGALAAGLVQTHNRVHRGQGTANACFAFGAVFIELLWCRDRAEIDGPTVARTGLSERTRWRQTGACPFGVCLRATHPPFAGWTYDVPFPAGMSAEMAITDVAEPLLFSLDIPKPASRSVQSLGERITAVELAFPHRATPSEALDCLRGTMVSFRDAASPHMTVTLDGGRRGRATPLSGLGLTVFD